MNGQHSNNARRNILRTAVVLVLLVALHGCITDGIDEERYVRDGIQYGVTEGRFRDRWWNYYERGRSFQDGKFLEEAERDLRVALDVRSRDQRWARTYGLHFVPEYFPNRELGITLFYKKRIEEAIARLETSLEQRYSARAAYFLDEARAAWVASNNLDTSPPTIEIIAPATAAGLSSLDQELVAVIRDDTFVRDILIGGEPYPLDLATPEMEIIYPLRLAPGPNRVPIQITDIAGNVTKFDLILRTDVDGPAVSFDEPGTVPGFVTGVAYDPAGVYAMRVGGQAVSLRVEGNGLVAFGVDANRVAANPRLSFECEDDLGNITTGRLPAPGGTAAVRGQIVFASGPRGTQDFRLAADTGNSASIEFTNLIEGLRFLKDEIVVSMRISSPDEIQSLDINGVPIESLIPGRREQRVSRRIRLEHEGPNLLVASLSDASGNKAQERLTVVREFTEIESGAGRLTVALLGNVWEHSGPVLPGESEVISDELARVLFERGRFDLLSRDALPQVLAEQELVAALGSRKARAALGSVIQAELLIIGKIRRSGEALEIILQAISSDTSRILAYADVAGPVRSIDDLTRLVYDLALRLEQEFPRVQGLIIDVDSPNKLLCDLTEAHGLRPELRCIVFRKGEERVHPVTGQTLGAPMHILAEGYLDSVQKQLSTIRLDKDPPGDIRNPIEVMDLVITK